MNNKEQTTNIVTGTYKVSGMTCAACANSIETYLSPQEGIEHVAVNYPNQTVALKYDASLISINEIETKTKEIGYTLFIGTSDSNEKAFQQNQEDRLALLKTKLLVAAILSIPVFVLSMFFPNAIAYQNWLLLALSAPVLLYSGSEFFVIAWKKLKHASTNMDTLVALSTGIAFVFSVFNTVYPQFFLNRGLEPHVYFESAVIIITLILLGRYLEEKAKGRTSSAIKKLIGLKPSTVTAIRNGEEMSLAISEIVVGDLLVVKPGEKIPVDGKVKKGTSYVDESMLSGEAIPLHKEKGSIVFAGTINQKGSIRILASEVGDTTVLAQIIKSVEHALSTKPNVQKLADKIASIFVPLVIGIAILTFLLWYFIGPEPKLTYAFLSLITVLIIACPCALGLATPTALMVGIGKGAEQGILIQDAQALETAYKLNTLVLDKTGTITKGEPVVTDSYWKSDEQQEKYKEVIVALESQSEHPLADAVTAYLKESSNSLAIENFESITGLGVSALVNNELYFIGNNALIEKHNISISSELEQQAEALKKEAKTVVYFSTSKEVKAILAIADQVKDSSKKAILQLQQMGIEVHMLTGDNKETAKHIANQVGIKHIQAEVLPSEKGKFIEQLQQEGKTVAMVGDGINDSNALAQANIGIAMATGTDIAMESSGITLLHSDLNHIIKAISLSRETMKTVKQNLFWAFIYNIFAIPIAAGVLYPAYGFLLNPMVAGAAMSFSSISVLLNSLRLKNKVK